MNSLGVVTVPSCFRNLAGRNSCGLGNKCSSIRTTEVSAKIIDSLVRRYPLNCTSCFIYLGDVNQQTCDIRCISIIVACVYGMSNRLLIRGVPDPMTSFISRLTFSWTSMFWERYINAHCSVTVVGPTPHATKSKIMEDRCSPEKHKMLLINIHSYTFNSHSHSWIIGKISFLVISTFYHTYIL